MSGLKFALQVYFSHKPNWIYFALLASSLTYSLRTGAILEYAWVVFLVFASTPLIEYFTHKYILHLPMPKDSQKHPFWHQLVYRIHYAHHENPKKVDHIFAEWWFTLPLFALYNVGVYLLSRSLSITAVFATALLVYFLIYEWTHYMAHCDAYAPKNRYSRFLKKFHSWHHYKNEDYWYGITSPVADFIFGKWKNPKAVEASELALKNRGHTAL